MYQYRDNTSHHVFLHMILWEEHKIIYVVFLPKMHNLNLIIKKHQKKKNQFRDSLQNNWLEIFNIVRVIKVNEELNNSDWRRLKRHNNTWSWTGFYFLLWRLYWKSDKTSVGSLKDIFQLFAMLLNLLYKFEIISK